MASNTETFTGREVVNDHFRDFIHAQWGLAKLMQCTDQAGDDEIEIRLAVRTAFNQMAFIIRFIRQACPDLEEQFADIYQEATVRPREVTDGT